KISFGIKNIINFFNPQNVDFVDQNIFNEYIDKLKLSGESIVCSICKKDILSNQISSISIINNRPIFICNNKDCLSSIEDK
ncbi:MAG TPA: hypothetical protein VGB37_18045, partial [Candidatus Lokiarchaeia archaeon]